MKRLKADLHSNFVYIVLGCLVGVCMFISFQEKDTRLEKQVYKKVYIESITKKDKSIMIEGKGKNKYLLIIKNKIQENINYQLGDQLEIRGVMRLPNRNTNFHLFHYRKYLKSKKIKHIIYVDSIKIISKNRNLLYGIKNKWIDKINTYENKEYLSTFLLGDSSFLSKHTKEAMRNIGVSHLLAISGMHVTFLSFFLLKILNFISPYVKVNEWICILLLLFYLFLTSFAPSIARATYFFIFLKLNKQLQLGLSSVKLLYILCCLFLLYNPYYLYHIGFLFSFVISFAFLLCRDILFSHQNKVLTLCKTSCFSFFISLPIVSISFFEINILSPIYNVFFIPYITFIVFPLSILSFLFPALQSLFQQCLYVLEQTAFFLSSIPGTVTIPRMNIVIIFIYYILLLFLLKYKKRKCLFFTIFLLFLHFLKPCIRLYDTLTMIDVGQGDSFLLELKSGKNILIDTGGNANYKGESALAYYSVIPYLKMKGIYQIDLLLLTHGDYDHIGDTTELLENRKVKKVIMNASNDNVLEKEIINKMKKKKIPFKKRREGVEKVASIPFFFLNKGSIENENDDSLIVYTKINNKHILFMGDASKEIEKNILHAYLLPKMDILKIGHHGSKTSTGEPLIAQLKPRYSLISAKENNIYGHPHPDILNRLQKYNTKVLDTRIHGMTTFILKQKIEVITCL